MDNNVAKLVIGSEEVVVPPYKVYTYNLGLKAGKNTIPVFAYDKKENMLGIEILGISKRIPKKSLSQISVKNLVVAQ